MDWVLSFETRVLGTEESAPFTVTCPPVIAVAEETLM